MTRVFISYRHEGDAHGAAVREFALALRAAGVTVVLDQLEQAERFRGGGPDEGWPAWCERQAAGGRALIVASPGWFRCYGGTENPGAGLGAAIEAAVLRQRVYNEGGESGDIRVVRLAGTDMGEVPLGLQRFHSFHHPTDLAAVCTWLGVRSAVAHGWPALAPQVAWQIANHDAVPAAVAGLLTSASPGRLLPVRGPSGTGKTTTIDHVFAHALGLPWLSAGRIDFKGTADLDSIVDAAAGHLGIPVPRPGALVDRLGSLLATLRERKRPTLLLFDTYEAAAQDARRWVEKTLLLSLLQADWLRIIVAGQEVPLSVGAPWASRALPTIVLKAPGPEDWYAYFQRCRPDLTVEEVITLHRCAGGNPSVLASFAPLERSRA